MAESEDGCDAAQEAAGLALRDAERFLGLFVTAPSARRSRLAKNAPVRAIQAAALRHPDPFVRRGCLGYLDHYANDISTFVFAEALADPVEPVRHTALHSIACETCRAGTLCVADVIPHLMRVLDRDPSAELRHKAIPVLLRLADRDASARAAVVKASTEDPDDLVREVAARALAGEHVRARKMYQRAARRARRQRVHP